MKKKRILYYVPIVHTNMDYGEMGTYLFDAIEKNPQPHIRQHLKELMSEIQNFWRVAREEVLKEIKNFRGVRVYQDSMPFGERKKVLRLFDYMLTDNSNISKSPNFLLIKELLAKGAILEGIEDMNLLKAQLDVYKTVSQARTKEEQAEILNENKPLSDEITQKRDEVIAQKINETLPSGGTGILFIGMKHNVIKELERLDAENKLVSPLKIISFSRSIF